MFDISEKSERKTFRSHLPICFFGVRRGWKLGASRKIWHRKLFSSFYLTCSSGKLVDKLTPVRSFLWSFNLISRKVLQLLYRGSHKNLKRCRWISGEFISLKSWNIKRFRSPGWATYWSVKRASAYIVHVATPARKLPFIFALQINKCQLNESFIFLMAASVMRINNKSAIMEPSSACERLLPGQRQRKRKTRGKHYYDIGRTGPVRGILNKHKSHLKRHNSYLFAVSMLLHAQQNPGGPSCSYIKCLAGRIAFFNYAEERKAFTSADKGREHVATKDETSSPH